ncbi:MAG TPA: hypothetical protein PKZ82_16095, partial [Microthrixaceae bacterium]|nr:hypothetical protein [Microthrixaceae bacterium]
MADIVMPQLGESVTEGTITRWFKAVGESVTEDEPLFEVSTDKVDTEVPAPASGVLSEIRVQEGETVDVGPVLAVLGDGAGAAPAAFDPAANVQLDFVVDRLGAYAYGTVLVPAGGSNATLADLLADINAALVREGFGDIQARGNGARIELVSGSDFV